MKQDSPTVGVVFKTIKQQKGWAQVKQADPRTEDGVKERLEYDLFYIVNMSVFLDLFIEIKDVSVGSIFSYNKG